MGALPLDVAGNPSIVKATSFEEIGKLGFRNPRPKPQSECIWRAIYKKD